MKLSSSARVDVVFPTGTANGTAIPQDLAGHLSDLESWAAANHKDAKSDLVLFWLLKLPAIVASAAAGVLATLDQKTVSLVVGMLASVCVLVDGLQPRGTLRNIHLRAVHDIRALTNGILAQWRARDQSKPEAEVVRSLIESAEPERLRIAQYVRDGESSLASGAGKA